jgi:ABC-type cobalamin/Fe3+-siderophores transport system ATPase subunit
MTQPARLVEPMASTQPPAIADVVGDGKRLGAGACVITVDHPRKTYGRVVAVDDLSFEVEAGEIFGILGPNGAGKTTTVECVQGLRRPDSGTTLVLGLDPTTQGAKLRQRIGAARPTAPCTSTTRSATETSCARGLPHTRNCP